MSTETFTAVTDSIRVRVVDDGRGAITYTLQSRMFGTWRDAAEGRVCAFYNVPATEA